MKASQMYTLNHHEVAQQIAAFGHHQTLLVQGHIGSGKSSLLKTLSKMFPDHTPCYFDGTTKDLGDIMIPKLAELNGQDFVRYAPNEEFGVHLNKPVLLMIDEYGKANPAVKNGLLAVMQEHRIGATPLHPESRVFATTNLGAEGVGDILPPHARNRVTIVNMRKPTSTEWIEWGLDNDIDPVILGWVRDNPQVLNSFEDHNDPEENPYIFHPRSNRASFVTPRSLEKASVITKRRDVLGIRSVTAALMGTLGERAAMDMGAWVDLADQLPSMESIRKTPQKAKVPENAAAICMVVYKALMTIESSWVAEWFEYMGRLPNEAKAMFINNVRSTTYSNERRNAVFNHPTFTQYLYAHAHLFSADQ